MTDPDAAIALRVQANIVKVLDLMMIYIKPDTDLHKERLATLELVKEAIRSLSTDALLTD